MDGAQLERDAADPAVAFVNRYLERISEAERGYAATHMRRFVSTIRAIPRATNGGFAVEVGTYGFFMWAMRELLGYSRVEGTIFELPGPKPTALKRCYAFDDSTTAFHLYNLDLERQYIPITNESVDFLLAAEIIEHFASDPNFFFFEANRILKQHGTFLITTPNVCCAENIFRILWRQVPNSYYFYRRDGSTDRHNLEYGPDLLKQVVENAGFSIMRMWTETSWFEPRPEILQLINRAEFPEELREDNLFFLCVKTAAPKERYPEFLYH